MSKHWAPKGKKWPAQTIRKGDMVRHASRGIGEVLEEWGTWTSCRNCFRPFPETRRYQFGGLATVCCGAPILAVSGQNIFDVKFGDGKTYSIHARFLDKVEQLDTAA